MVADDVPEPEKFFGGVEISGRIVRVADQDRLGLGGDCLLEILCGREGESVLDAGCHGPDCQSCRLGE